MNRYIFPLLYTAVMAIIAALIFIFRKYRADYSAGLSAKEHPLKSLYGISFKITDVLGKFILSVRKGQCKPFGGIREKLGRLHPGDDLTRLTYLYIAKRTSAAIAIIFLFSFAGCIYTLSWESSDSSVTSLPRPTDGSDSTSYSLYVSDGETTETVDLDVSKKIYEYGQVIAIFDSHRQDIVSAMLGENDSPEHVTKPLNFISSVGDEGIELSWVPENTSYIDYSGNIIKENIDTEGTVTCVYVTMKLDGVEATLMAGITLYPPEEDTSLQAQVMNYIKTTQNPHSDNVLLPTGINGTDIRFSYTDSVSVPLFFSISVIVTAVYLIISLHDMDSKLKKRGSQMMHDYPELVSKLLLLCSAGLNIRNALQKIASDYQASKGERRYAYEELCITLRSMENGKSETTAYTDYGKRCGLMPYVRLGTLLQQNLSKGSKEMRFLLNNEVKNAFENHRAETISMSKKAETKLMIPMIMLLIIVMVLIMVPSFMNI